MFIITDNAFNTGTWGEEVMNDIVLTYIGRIVYAVNTSKETRTIQLPFKVWDNSDCTNGLLALAGGHYTVLARRL